MKKLLVALALLTLSTVGLAIEVVPVVNPVGNDKGSIFIVDGRSVYRCGTYGCVTVSSDYRKPKSEDPYFTEAKQKTKQKSYKIIEINGKDVK
jgi:hypothetical protein